MEPKKTDEILTGLWILVIVLFIVIGHAFWVRDVHELLEGLAGAMGFILGMAWAIPRAETPKE